jgi:mRNA-degrading endonuclease YafQ of YafQ-DinJ toxin-antitoxin module
MMFDDFLKLKDHDLKQGSRWSTYNLCGVWGDVFYIYSITQKKLICGCF